MLLKDYYTILELPPHATTAEIKKSYRRLVMIYHPDKTKNEPYASARFDEIKEAYETLTNPVKKQYYLQQRWYKQSTGEKDFEDRPHTPVTVLNDCLQLKKFVQGLNDFHLDKQALLKQVKEILNTDTITMLQRFNDPAVNNEISHLILDIIKPLDFSQISEVVELINRFASKEMLKKASSILKEKKEKNSTAGMNCR